MALCQIWRSEKQDPVVAVTAFTMHNDDTSTTTLRWRVTLALRSAIRGVWTESELLTSAADSDLARRVGPLSKVIYPRSPPRWVDP